MPLPKIEHPILKINVHSLGREVEFRPFLVKEEKLLLIAKESKEPDEIRTAIVQIIQNCCLEEGLDIKTLPLFDIEMVFVTLRSKSVGEMVQLVFHCNNEVDGKECNTDTDYALNLEKVKYEFPEGHSNKIMLTDTMGIQLHYPTLTEEIKFEANDEVFEAILHMLFNYVDCIFDGEEVYKPDDFGKEEFIAFIETLTVDKLNAIQNFFITSPKVVLEDTTECKACGYEHKIYSEDLLSFFL